MFHAADELLKSVENTAWEVRSLVGATTNAWADLRAEASGLANNLDTARSEARMASDRYGRLVATATMLAQVAVSYRMHSFRSAFVSREAAERSLTHIHERNAKRFYRTSVAQGGAFLKVGQLLSARHDILPAAWIRELGKLQSDVPPLPFEPIAAVIERDLGPLGERFMSIDAEAIAAASIGQVHRGITADGHSVAIKVQRPGIAELIETDLALLDLFLESIRSALPPTDLETIESEIKGVLRGETDYVLEREHMERVATFFRKHPAIIVPAPIETLSGPRVLTSAFADGRKITTVLDELAEARDAGNAEAGARLNRIMGLLLEAYLRMVLEAGCFQADPHPGNLLVTENDCLVVLDFGAARRMADDVRSQYLELIRAFVFDDRSLLVERLGSLGFRTESGKPDTLLAFAHALLAEMRHAVVSDDPFEWPTREQLLERAEGLLRQADADPVTTLPAEFVMIGRVFGTLGGLFSHYRPKLDVTQILLPIIGNALSSTG